ncbi:MAG: type II toxin-antitoxin system VapC family toxin [Candidatus Acidiferrales bacterium]
MKIFVDTWGWLVLADPKDPLHSEAVGCYEEFSGRTGRVVTSNFILNETFTLLFRRRPHKEALHFSEGLLQSPFIRIETVTEHRFLRAFELRRKFSDKPRISFTDLSSMAIMMELKVSDILTGDPHFNQVGFGFRTLPN